MAQGLGQLTAYGMDQKVATICGDSTFFHTILPGLVNAQYHNANMLLLVLDNSATAMTGSQPWGATWRLPIPLTWRRQRRPSAA